MNRLMFVVFFAVFFDASSLSAGENDYTIISAYKNKEYKQVILEKKLLKSPKWDIESGGKCPLTVEKAIKAARKTLEKLIPETKKWAVRGVSLERGKDKTHWHYDIRFESPDGWDNLNLGVYLDGSVPAIEER